MLLLSDSLLRNSAQTTFTPDLGTSLIWGPFFYRLFCRSHPSDVDNRKVVLVISFGMSRGDSMNSVLQEFEWRGLVLALLLAGVGSFPGCAMRCCPVPTYHEPQGFSSTYHEYLHEFDPTVGFSADTQQVVLPPPSE